MREPSNAELHAAVIMCDQAAVADAGKRNTEEGTGWLSCIASCHQTGLPVHPRGPLFALQLQAEISSTLLYQLDDLIKLMRHVFTTSFQTRQ